VRTDASDIIVHELVDQDVFVSAYTCQVVERWLGVEHIVGVFHTFGPEQVAEADCVARRAAVDPTRVVGCVDGIGRSLDVVSHSGMQGIVVTYTVDLRLQFV
jgi:hypothetical protein